MLAGVAFAAGTLCVTVFSLLPQDAIPHVDVSDKIQHLVAYLCLALTGGAAFPGRRSMAALGLGLVAVGIGLECAQMFVPGRSASVGDAVANTLGVVLGLAFAHIAHVRARRSA